LPGGTQEKHEKLKPRQQVSVFQHGPFEIRIIINTYTVDKMLQRFV